MTTFQNYNHFKLPITMEPLKYGKLIINIDNLFILQINRTNLALVSQFKDLNKVKLYRQGDFMFEYTDFKISNNSFIRSLNNKKFTFIDLSLKSIEEIINRLNVLKRSTLFIILVLFILFFFLKFPEVDIVNISLVLFSKQNITKLRKVESDHKWDEIKYKVNKDTFSNVLFKSLLNKFWNKIQNKFTNDNHMFILFKIQYITGENLSIGKLQRLNKEDKTWYIQYMLNFISLKSEFYKESQIEALIFSYGFKNGKSENKYAIPFGGSFQSYGKSQLPISMNPLDFGIITDKIITENKIIYIIHSEKGETISFIEFKDYNDIKISKSGKTLLTFKDKKSESGFMRIIDNKTFYFENGQQILFTNEIKSGFISKTNISKNIVNNFITLDIETYIKDGLLTPYLICFYDGKDFFSFYLSDYNSIEEMMIDCLKSLLIRKYNYYKVYAHNMAKFDLIFILKYLVKLGKIKPIVHNGKFISVSIAYGDNEQYNIEFKDSILLLLSSLESLCSSFKIEEAKSIFPHLFVNENNLNYIGDIPTIKSFIDISNNEYQDYKNSYEVWSLKSEAIKYCKIDCISLYKILYNFNSMIFKLFSVNIHRYPTLSSLAFAIFRAKFMNQINIPKLQGKIAKDIRQGYTGGAVDMYIPEGENIKCYDVNSLYPSQMESKLMPIGNPTFFEGNIRNIDSNAFGFFYCEIIAPDKIKHPIIQTRVNVHGVNKTIAPIGTWEDMLFSEELYNAEKYGYKFNIIWGYTFKTLNIFKEYVDFLYDLRSKYPKSDPMNFISKILMNSLYGRFGMNENFDNIEVIHKDYYPDFENKFIDQITDKIILENHIIVFYISPDEDHKDSQTSVGIASAITAYSRIHMSQFKNNPDINLYYSDTDSIYTDSELDESFIDNKVLGKLKLENICKKAIFLSPKVYCLITNSNEFIFKIKGLSHKIKLNYSDFKKLLTRNTFIEKTQAKWFRNLSEAKITILEQKATKNKRQLIYDKNNKLIRTENYKIENLKDLRI